MTHAMEVAQAFALQIYAYQKAGKYAHEAARPLSYALAATDAELERKNHALAAIVAAFAVAYADCPPPSAVEQEVISIARRARAAVQEDPAAAEPVTLTYRNWRGEVGERCITPKSVWFGTTEWHPTPQWLLTAYDHEKAADRDFALQDFGAPRPAPQAATAASSVEQLLADALAEAERAMQKFPQPNYVISKVAEEAGEVVKAAIHCAEGRETAENVVAEIKQAIAMLIRLYVEGDQVHGLPALSRQA